MQQILLQVQHKIGIGIQQGKICANLKSNNCCVSQAKVLHGIQIWTWIQTHTKLKLTAVAHTPLRRSVRIFGPHDTMQHENPWDSWRVSCQCKGTWKFEIEDDQKIRRTIQIPHILYCKDAPYFLLSSQHWSQQSADQSGTHCNVDHDTMQLL